MERYISGETVTLWGEPRTLKVFATGKSLCRLSGDEIFMEFPVGADKASRSRILTAFLREELNRAIIEEAALCEPIVGKSAAEYKIKSMRTRWGTCNIEDRRIWINLDLVHLPRKCLHYVMIHELTHLYERHHNTAFYAYMDSFLPDWRLIKKEMNEEYENA